MASKYHFPNIIGCSKAIQAVFAQMEGAIDSDSDVLITGETGTGKELVARAIHDNSVRRNHPVLAINCGAVPKDVLFSELFGHCQGAFDGAIEGKVGLFEAAEGGTLILDEISDMPIDVQSDLLRVLTNQQVTRLGETTGRAVDVRAIAISNRELLSLVEAGGFREDLYNRLKAFEIHLPPLRERRDDIPLLADYFYEEACRQNDKGLAGFAPGVLEMLSRYHWPGNVRELRNAIRRGCALAGKDGYIGLCHLLSQIIQEKPEM